MAWTRTISISLALAAIVCAGSARAELRCSEGRTKTGECVNPGLAYAMRHQGIILAQPKISMTAPLNLPSEDDFYPAQHDHHEQTVFFGFPATRPDRRIP